jgi:hypothetical protein
VGLNLVVVGFAAMDRLHIESMTQDEGNAFLGTQIG